jgi:hypothetical protein
MFKRAIKAQIIAYYIQGLAYTVYSLSTFVLHKTIVIYVLFFILYKTKA